MTRRFSEAVKPPITDDRDYIPADCLPDYVRFVCLAVTALVAGCGSTERGSCLGLDIGNLLLCLFQLTAKRFCLFRGGLLLLSVLFRNRLHLVQRCQQFFVQLFTFGTRLSELFVQLRCLVQHALAIMFRSAVFTFLMESLSGYPNARCLLFCFVFLS